jgi:hypothetical protein
MTTRPPTTSSSATPTATAFWSSIGVTAASSPSVRELWNAGVPPSTLRRHRAMFILLYCWNIWKHRNAVVNEHRPCLQRLFQACNDDAKLWAHRLPADEVCVAQSWCNLLSPM